MIDRAVTPDVHQLIMTRGKAFIPAPLPADLRRFAVGKCFDAAALTCTQMPERYRYVEGIAEDPRQKGDWILHAWVTDEKGINAYDLTWCQVDGTGKELPIDTRYLGIQMPIEAVARFMLYTKYAGVIANRHRAPDLYRACLGL